MKLNKKSILALILSLAMALSLVPAAAFAEDGENAAPRDDIEITVDEEKIEELDEEILEAEAPVSEEPEEEAEAAEESEETAEAPEEIAEEAAETIEEPAEEAAEEPETPAEEVTEEPAEEVETPAEEETAEDAEISEDEASESVETPEEEQNEEPENVEEGEAAEVDGEETPAEKEIPEMIFDVVAVFEYIMNLEDEAEAEDYINSLTEEQLKELQAYAEAYRNEIRYGETIEGVIAFADETVNVIEAAPLVKELSKKKLMKVMAAPAKAPLQGSNDTVTPPKDVDGLITNKTAVATDNGQYLLTLETYTTGTIRMETTAVPTDIVLVLDQSGSMTNTYKSIAESTFQKINFTRSYFSLNDYDPNNGSLAYGGNLFMKLSDGSFSRVEVNWFLERYTYTWTDENGDQKTAKAFGSLLDAPSELRGNIYRMQTTTSSVSRLSALKDAAATFISNVQSDAENNDVDHRIAVVGFASNGSDYNDNPWENTELLSTQNVVGYNNVSSENYAAALVPVNDNGNVNSRLTTAINRLDASGGTYINYGLEMAQGVFENTSDTDSNGTKRNRVVVILTDGVPGNGSWGNNVTKNSCASDAISKASVLKNTGVTVYSVGIFDGADATSAGSDTGTTTQKTNYFMQQLSSNNGIPRTPSYYMSADNPEALNSIFQSISEQISTPTISLGSKTVVHDIVSQYFEIPNGATVSLYTAACNGMDESGNFTFGSRTVYSPGDNDVTIDRENGIVNVSGFNFDNNFCAKKDNNSYQGNKLIIEFVVTPKSDFLGGNKVFTNGSASGVYSDDKIIANFEQPVVDVPLACPSYTAYDKNIYYGAATVPGTTDLFKMNSYTWEDNFVTWSLSSGAVDNTVDKQYAPTITVTPIYEGSVTSETYTGSTKANVNVFTPEASFKDSSIYLSQTPDYADNYVENSLIWVHGSGTGKKTSDQVTMINDAAPEVTYSYSIAASAFTDCTTVTAKPVVAGHEFGGDDFTVHVFVPDASFADSKMYLTQTADYSKNLSSVTWSDNDCIEKPQGEAPAVSFNYNKTAAAFDECTEVTVSSAKVGGNNTVYVFSAAKNFTVHVLTPTVTWTDTRAYYGAEIPAAFSPVGDISWNDASANHSVKNLTLGGTGSVPAADNFSYTFAFSTPIEMSGKKYMPDTDVNVKVTAKLSANNKESSKVGFAWISATGCVTGEADPNPTYQFRIHPDFCTLTVSKSGIETIDENQACIFTVTGGNVRTTVTVAVEGKNSVTIGHLPTGDYTVTENDEWSWRYELTKNGSATLSTTSASGACVLSNTRNEIYWLNGCSYAVNVWTDDGIDAKKSVKKGGQ